MPPVSCNDRAALEPGSFRRFSPRCLPKTTVGQCCEGQSSRSEQRSSIELHEAPLAREPAVRIIACAPVEIVFADATVARNRPALAMAANVRFPAKGDVRMSAFDPLRTLGRKP